MNKIRILETIDFYMSQVIQLANRGKNPDAISVIEALRYIEKEVNQLPDKFAFSSYWKEVIKYE